MKTILIFYPFNHLYTLCKFRCGSHRLPIETGRWQGITRDNRVCHLIDSNDIGNEYHYVMICHSMKADRKKFLSEYFWKYPNTCKFILLFNCTNAIQLEKLCKFIKIINVKVSSQLNCIFCNSHMHVIIFMYVKCIILCNFVFSL